MGSGSSIIGDNYIYGRDADISALFQGTGSDWSDFIPVAGSVLDGLEMGAIGYINDLLEGIVPGDDVEVEKPTPEVPAEDTTDDEETTDNEGTGKTRKRTESIKLKNRKSRRRKVMVKKITRT